MIPLKTDKIRRTLGIARLQGHYFTKPVQEFFDYLLSYYKQL
jgi:hypothetical protein